MNTRKTKRYFFIFVLPTLLAFTIVFFLPFLMGIWLSFTKFTTVTDAEFIGLKNYVRAFQNESFRNALWFTVRFALLSVVTINIGSFLLALGLTQKMRGTNLFRTVFFMPNLIGGIVLGYIWQLILNGILSGFGLTLTYAPKYGFFGMLILMNWQMLGYLMVIYIAGLQNIPGDVREAARIDGAGRWQMLRSITFPLVMPSFTICLFLSISNSFKLFDQNLALTAGAPSGRTAMLALDIYETFYNKVGREGVGQAKAVVFFLIVAVITALQLYLTRRNEVEN